MVFLLLICSNIFAQENPDKNRDQAIKQYLAEFVSGNIQHAFSSVDVALHNVLRKVPDHVFQAVTDRKRPVIFVDYYTSGIARFAGSTEFVFREGDQPAFQDGFYLIQLGDALDSVEDPIAIEGVILHEIAHRILEHLKADHFSCALEREANRLVKSWGFEQEFLKAKEYFGSKSPGDSPCHDKKD